MKLAKIKLYGTLAEEYGKEFELAVTSVGEAVRALYVNFPKLKKEFLDGKYHVFVAENNIAEIDLLNPTGQQTIKIVPYISGAKSGFFKVILGVALIGASIALGGIPGTAFAGIGGGIGGGLGATLFTSALRSIGFSLLFGGLSQIFFKPPDSATTQTEPAESTPNFAFSGAVNTTAQGAAVPICYGRLIVGSAVISAGISTDQV